MKSTEMANEIARLSNLAGRRVTGIGADQYDDGSGTQKFEKLSLDELEDWLEEEIADVIAYASMAAIRTHSVLSAARSLQEKNEALMQKFTSKDHEMIVLKTHLDIANKKLRDMEAIMKGQK